MSSNDAASASSVPLSGPADDEVNAAFDVNSQTLDSGALCSLCRHIDFEYVGFHPSSEYTSSHWSVQREFPSLLRGSENCAFCRKIVNMITSWLSKSPGDKTEELDIYRSRVEVSHETDWHEVAESEGRPNKTAHSVRIRISCAITRLTTKNETDQTRFLTFFLQRYEEPPVTLHKYLFNTCNNHNFTLSEHECLAYGGRKRPLTADLALFKRWKQMCQQLHGEKCTQVFKGTPKIRPRVIDVDRRCLVTAKEDDRWVCLSYVWGKTAALRLMKCNIQAFSMPGSLRADHLPTIVEDALQLAKGVEEKYLWVDSLCIVQDDEDDKAEFISRMDSIYSLATIVIIAATCVDANSCLPGVRPGSRFHEQEPFVIRNITLVQSLDPINGVKVDLRTGRATAYIGETIWDTRAWTLQERFLASKSLVCTAEQIFWECEEAFWCEDSLREIPGISPDPHRTSLCGGELNLSWSSDIVTFDHYYRVLLEDYSGRALSFDIDGLNAFSGIIRALERSMALKFFWGMPIAFLESALAWGNRTHALRRRHGVQKLSSSSPQSGSQFPSWSWVGWTGDGKAKLDNQKLTTESLGLEFYCVSEDGTTMQDLKQAVGFNKDVDLLAEGSSIPDRSSRLRKVVREDLPTDSPVSLSLVLCFWTMSAHLNIIHLSDNGLTSANSEPFDWEMIMSDGDQRIHVSWFHIPSLKQGDHVEVAAVAQNRGDWDNGHIANGAIGVMIISWEGDIAFREGFAWIPIRSWTSLRNRKWRLIVLG